MDGINVLSLFDGMSCGRIALERAGIKVNKYFASEIDKFAIQVTQKNYPDTIQIGSVTEVDVSQLEPIDLLIGGSPCFGAGTKVLTIDGYKDIEALKVGDEVLTHNNRYRKVLAIGSKVAVTYNLKIHGAVDTIVTANHPYYARKKESVWLNDLRTRRVILGENEWISADKLTGKYRVAHINCDIEENPLGITKDEAFIIGRYIADGHTRKDYRTSEGRPNHRHWQLILSIGEQKVNDFNSPLKHSLYKHGDSTYRVVFSNKRLVEIVEKHCGCGAENKFFSEMLIKLPKDILMEVFNGYISGDGCISNGVVQCSSVSRMLAITLQRVVHKLFGLSLTVFQHRCAGKRMLMGREITQKDCYIMRFNPHQEDKNYTTKDGFYLWVNAKKLTHIGKDIVYNIEVEEDNSYTANGIVVHNCQSFSFAGKRNGMTTTCNEEIYTLEKYLELKNDGFKFEGESYLFWEYMRILTDIRKYNPNVLFLLENVEMGAKWERVLSEAIGIFGVHINSALVSAQNRRRIYWTNIRVREEGLFGELHSDIPQPEDRGILLKDILEDNVDEKYYLSDKASAYLNRDEMNKRFMQSYNDDKSICVTANFHKGIPYNVLTDRDKSNCITSNYGNLDTRNYIKGQGQIIVAMRGRGDNNEQQLEPQSSGKTNTLTSVQKDNLLMQVNPSLESGRKQPYQQTRRGRKMTDKSNCLMAKETDFMHYSQNARIRRLTPVECERLQTVSSNSCTINIELCLDQAKSYVNVVEKSPKLLKLVSSAEKIESSEFVRNAAMSILQKSQQIKYIAQENADTPTQKQTNECTEDSQKEANIIAECAENTAMSQNRRLEGGSVPLNAFINITEGKITHFGKEELHQKDNRYIRLMSGENVLNLYGKEIMQLVEDADVGTKNRKDMSSIYTILYRLDTRSIEQMLTILYLFAKSAISGFTQNEINQEILSVQFNLISGYTACVSDTQRYKMLGNGWNVETVAHIFKQIKWEGEK